MPITTRKSNAVAHPGRIVLESQTSRRTRQQIDEDTANAKAIATAAAEKQHAVFTRIAELEHSVELDEQANRMHSRRPDLRHGSRGATRLTVKIPNRNSNMMCASDRALH
jgi:hypothetical protein